MRGVLTLWSYRSDEWFVTVGDTYLVGFAGPSAREMAVRQHRELSALLDCADDAGPDSETIEPDDFRHAG
jgi:hypothetical protein